MSVVNIESTSGFEQVCDDTAPRSDVRKPTQRAEADVDDVEASARQRADGVVNVGADEGRSLRESRALGERASFVNRDGKSTPVTMAPARAQLKVSMPK
jgi:hypothetical protein